MSSGVIHVLNNGEYFSSLELKRFGCLALVKHMLTGIENQEDVFYKNHRDFFSLLVTNAVLQDIESTHRFNSTFEKIKMTSEVLLPVICDQDCIANYEYRLNFNGDNFDVEVTHRGRNFQSGRVSLEEFKELYMPDSED